MRCEQCGALLRPGMSRCANCGAPAPDQGGSSYDIPQQSYIPGGGQQGYIPGGGSAGSSGRQEEQRTSNPPQRPQGSLGRRLQQHPTPEADDGSGNYSARDRGDAYPPAHSAARSRPRPADQDEPYPPKPPTRSGRPRDRDEQDDQTERDYGPARDRRRPTSAGGRGRDWEEGDADAVDNSYGPAGRGRPPARRTPSRRPPMDDDRDNADTRRDAPRSGGPRRKADPDPNYPAWDESSDYANDPRGPSRGGAPGRGSGAPSGVRGGPSGRGASRYDGYENHDSYPDGGRRGGGRYDEPTGFTDERLEAFPPGADAFSAEFEAARRYQDDRRTPRGPGASRGPNRYDDDYESYGSPSAGASDRREMNGGYGSRAAYDESNVWQPGAPPIEVRPRTGSAAPAKQGNWFRLAFSITIVIVVVVGLVVVVGPDVAPKLGKYLPFLKTGPAATQAPAFATYTPGPTPTTPANDKLFTNTTGGFALAYPSSWATSTKNAAANDTLYQFTQSNGANVGVERYSAFDGITDAQIIQAEISGATNNGITLTEITGLATTEGVGGEIWQRHEYSETSKDGTKLHLALLVCHHLGKAYVISLADTDTGFTADDTAIFEPILRTFRFL